MVTAWKPSLPLDGHVFSYGRTGSGKTWKLMAIVQYCHSHGYKIFDLWGGKRKEGGFWCFPSDENKLWFEYEKEVGPMSSHGGKEYNVNLMYPFFYDNIDDKLPEEKPRISSIPFTIYFKSINVNEISTITGAIATNAKRVWNNIKKELPDDANGEDILKWFEKKGNTKYKTYNLYKSFIVPFCESKILMGKNCEYNIDLKEQAEDKDVITVLMDDYTPEEFKMFFILYFMHNIYEMGEADIIHRKNIGFFRELNYFMKVEDEAAQDAEQKQIMRNNFSNIARYGRTAFIVVGDTQSPSEVKGLVDGQDDLLCLNELPSAKDREKACDALKQSGRMSPEQVNFLGSVEMTPEKMVVVERHCFAKLIKRMQPPRTKCYKRVDGSFIKVWKKLKNSYVKITEDKSKISEIYMVRKIDLENSEETHLEEKYIEQNIVNKKRYLEIKSKELRDKINEPIKL